MWLVEMEMKGLEKNSFGRIHAEVVDICMAGDPGLGVIEVDCLLAVADDADQNYRSREVADGRVGGKACICGLQRRALVPPFVQPVDHR